MQSSHHKCCFLLTITVSNDPSGDSSFFELSEELDDEQMTSKDSASDGSVSEECSEALHDVGKEFENWTLLGLQLVSEILTFVSSDRFLFLAKSSSIYQRQYISVLA